MLHDLEAGLIARRTPRGNDSRAVMSLLIVVLLAGSLLFIAEMLTRSEAAAASSPVHVHDLRPVGLDPGGEVWKARVVIQVRNAQEERVAGAEVTGRFGAERVRSCTTDAEGECKVTVVITGPRGKIPFVVTDIDAPGGYDPSANHDAVGNDSDGTKVTIRKPLGAGSYTLIDKDTVVTYKMKLYPGDVVEFRNGARLSFQDGGRASWLGTKTFTWSDDGRVQNLERDIKIFGQGDIRFEHGSLRSTIRYVEIDLQPLQEVGHYPLHWHHVGEGSVGTVVRGVVVKNSTNRAFVPHASHGITFRGTIASNTMGTPYWWDLPCGTAQGCDQERSESVENNSHDIVWWHVLADGVHPRAEDSGNNLAAFLLGAGGDEDQDGVVERQNIIRDAVAMNVDGSGGAFHWSSAANKNIGGNVWFAKNLRAWNAFHGIRVWQNDGDRPHVVNGFRAWDLRGAGVAHGAYRNNYTYRDIDVEELQAHALGWQVVGGSIDHVVFNSHNLPGSGIVFTNVSIDRVTIQLGPNSNPGNYVFTNTGLSCSDVTVNSKVPGTTVKINGSTCQL